MWWGKDHHEVLRTQGVALRRHQPQIAPQATQARLSLPTSCCLVSPPSSLEFTYFIPMYILTLDLNLPLFPASLCSVAPSSNYLFCPSEILCYSLDCFSWNSVSSPVRIPLAFLVSFSFLPLTSFFDGWHWGSIPGRCKC